MITLSGRRIVKKYIRKDLTYAILIETFIMLCLIISLYTAQKNEYEKGIVINELGKQRMLTQNLSKNVGRKYNLMQAEVLGNIIEPDNIIKDKYAKIENDILNAADKFDKTHNEVKKGKIYVGYGYINLGKSRKKIDTEIKKVDVIWNDFQKSIKVILSKKEIDDEFIKAVIYINNNDDELMQYCDDITEEIAYDKTEISSYYRAISVVSAVLFLLTVGVLLYRLYKYLIIPLDAFLEGMGDIGVLKENKVLTMPTRKEVAPVILEVNKMSQKIERLISLIESLNHNLSISEELEFIFHKFSFFIPYSYIGVALVRDGGRTLEAAYGIGDESVKGLPQGMLGKRFAIDNTSLSDVIDKGKARIINDLDSYIADKPVKEYNSIIIRAGIKSSITLPLISNEKPIGAIFFSSINKDAYNEEHVKFLEVIAKSITISFDKNIFVDNLLYSSTLALAKLAEARDEDTGEHLERMKMYSRTIAQFLYEESKYKELITTQYIDDIERFSPMHDIGKVGIRDGILLKPGKLTAEEFDEMKKHTVFGGQVLRSAEENILQSGRSMFNLGIEIAEGHHEKWDGSGYPKGKFGEEIPLSARIVALADVFDALTSKRPYKKAFPFEESFGYIIEGSGKHFDPEIVNVFVRNKHRIYNLYKSFGIS